MINCVPEFRHWKADFSSIARYYRASARCETEMKNLVQNCGTENSGNQTQKFPMRHEIQFSERLLKFVNAVVYKKTTAHAVELGKGRLTHSQTKTRNKR